MKQISVIAILMLTFLAGCSSTHVTSTQNAASKGVSDTKTAVTKEASSTVSTENTTADQSQTANIDNNMQLANLNFDGKNQVVEVNQNRSTFSASDLSLSRGNWETFSNLDQYNRVGIANAMLHKSMMPTAKREPLYVKPTGWHNKPITVNGKREWLYNRCHLIGYQFTGQNNNMKNLMTGTKSFNDPGMLVYEEKVANYLKTTGNHVRYQVEPIFRGNELVARGVHMQAKSIEDNQLEFNVYIFNVEPGVMINYDDGTSKLQ